VSVHASYTVIWIPEDKIAKLCPKEYLAFAMERSKIPSLRNYNLVERFDWENDPDHYYSDNLTIEDKAYFEIASNIGKLYDNLKKKIYEKTEANIKLHSDFNECRFASSSWIEITEEEAHYEKLFDDPSKNIWVCDPREIKKVIHLDPLIMNYQ